ncbi:hypothetical protein [Fluviicola taffensis]|uniref:hypothetical protein n=1 Tax=Fluviicola taffensis TaxID=191579 RepID=UPI0031382450
MLFQNAGQFPATELSPDEHSIIENLFSEIGEEFQRIAKGAEKNCPVSGAFSFEITLEAELVS